jgi:two-component system, cell cycle sensor histidine kinase and response regulator CckA
MNAADPSGTSRFLRVVAFFRQLVTRSAPSGSTEPGHAARASERPPQIDLGDLAVAQFVHDLRNQMTVMMMCADAIFHLVPPGQATNEIAQLRQCAERASLLTRELLVAARPPSARQPVDLNQVIASGVVTLSRFSGEGIRLRLSLSAQPISIVAASFELERILLNLVLNARDAMPSGGLLTIETSMDIPSPGGRLQGPLPGPCARLTVSDTGCGMTPQIRARIFDPFFTTKPMGTGLGLSSVAFTVQQLRGAISVQSEPGQGTSVTVKFPLPTDRSGL